MALLEGHLDPEYLDDAVSPNAQGPHGALLESLGHALRKDSKRMSVCFKELHEAKCYWKFVEYDLRSVDFVSCVREAYEGLTADEKTAEKVRVKVGKRAFELLAGAKSGLLQAQLQLELIEKLQKELRKKKRGLKNQYVSLCRDISRLREFKIHPGTKSAIFHNVEVKTISNILEARKSEQAAGALDTGKAAAGHSNGQLPKLYTQGLSPFPRPLPPSFFHKVLRSHYHRQEFRVRTQRVCTHLRPERLSCSSSVASIES